MRSTILDVAKRFGVLLGASIAVVVLGVLPLGLVLGASANRAASLGFYLLGSFLMIAGFFVGNRGPLRSDDVPETPRLGRRIRSATKGEMLESVSVSAVFIVLGLVLIVLGALVDARTQLV